MGKSLVIKYCLIQEVYWTQTENQTQGKQQGFCERLAEGHSDSEGRQPSEFVKVREALLFVSEIAV